MVCSGNEELKKAWVQLFSENGTSVNQTIASVFKYGHYQS